MRRDKNAPALLEVMSTRRPEVPLRPSPPTPRPAPPPRTPRPQAATPADLDHTLAEPKRLLSPGTTLRVPVGFLIPLVLLMAALLVGAYATGYQSRRAEERREAAAAAAREMGTIIDPLAQPQSPRSSPALRTPTRPTSQPAAPAESTRTSALPDKPPPPKADSSKREGYIVVARPEDDPRQAGLNYLIAATLPPDEAEKAARFLASKGLEIAVVPADHRGSLRWVVVLKGVAAKDLSTPAPRQLEQRLQELGREYRQVHKGPTVFNDPWWKKHTK